MLFKNIAHVGSFKYLLFVYLCIYVFVYLCILHLIHRNVIFDILESHAFQKCSKKTFGLNAAYFPAVFFFKFFSFGFIMKHNWIYHETQLTVAMDTVIYKDQCNKVCKGKIIYSFKTSSNERCSKFGMKIYQIRGRLLLNLLWIHWNSSLSNGNGIWQRGSPGKIHILKKQFKSKSWIMRWLWKLGIHWKWAPIKKTSEKIHPPQIKKNVKNLNPFFVCQKCYI